MATSRFAATLNQMRHAVDDELAAARATARPAQVWTVDLRCVGEAPGGWLYQFRLPAAEQVADDAEVELSVPGRSAVGMVVRVEDGRCTLCMAEDLGAGPISAQVCIDERNRLRALRARLSARPGERPGQAMLMLGAPSAPLSDAIAATAATLRDDGLGPDQAAAVRTALRERATFLWAPPGTDRTAVLVRLLEQLHELDASVLYVAASNVTVDHTVLRLCERLATRSSLRSGVLQRVGHIGLTALRQRFADLVDPAEISSDLHRTAAERAAALRAENLRLRYEQARFRVDEVEHVANDLAARIVRARRRSRLARLVGGENADALLVELHRVRVQRRAAGQARDSLASALGEANLPAGLAAGSSAAERPVIVARRRRQITAELRELEVARAGIEPTLRARCRLVATTATLALLGPLPRASFDVVVIDDAASLPLPVPFYLAGMSTRSVVVAGDFRQPGPVPQSRSAVVQEWFQRDVFAAAGLLDATGAVRAKAPLTRLSVQRRARAEICALANAVGYPDAPLSPRRANPVRMRTRLDDPEQRALLPAPVCYLDTSRFGARTTPSPSGVSRQNVTHALLVRELVGALYRSGQVTRQPHPSFLVLSPYRAQARLLDPLLAEVCGASGELLCATARRYQGGARGLVVLDLTEGVETGGGWSLLAGSQHPGSRVARLLTHAVSQATDVVVVVGAFDALARRAGTTGAVGALVRHLREYGRPLDPGRFIRLAGTAELAAGPVALPPVATVRAVDFAAAFAADVRAARRTVDVWSAHLDAAALRRCGPALADAGRRGVRLTVHVADAEDRDQRWREEVSALVGPSGRMVRDRLADHGQAGVVDREVLWSGPAGPGSADGLMVRCEHPRLCAEVLSVLEPAQPVRASGPRTTLHAGSVPRSRR